MQDDTSATGAVVLPERPRPGHMRRVLKGVLVSLGVFVAVGTVTALWENPFFVRMTPVGIWELPASVVLALLSGFTAGFWVVQCPVGGAGSGGVAGFVGIACPTCNKILMLIFGGPALLAWFDPIRPYITAAGLLAMSVAAARTYKNYRELAAASSRPRA